MFIRSCTDMLVVCLLDHSHNYMLVICLLDLSRIC